MPPAHPRKPASRMIDALDHLVLAADDPAESTAAYNRFLGIAAGQDGMFRTANLALAVIARTTEAKPGLAAAGFAVADLGKARRLLQQRGLPVGADTQQPGVTANGLDLRFVQPAASPAPAPVEGGIAGLDHVVVRSANPDRTIALLSGRLGLDLRMDRTFADWGTRLLFFRCGDLVVEVAHDLKAGISDKPDYLWGLSWRAAGLEAAHARLAAAGVEVSEIRTGRRPGTRVFTARDPALGVPTLVLGLEPKGQHDVG